MGIMANDPSTNKRCPNCARLEGRIAELEERVAQLERLLQNATRAQKRQAAPFSKGPPKANPQKPGRKAGDDYGTKAHRLLPEQKPDEIIDVPLPEQCPDCGGEAEEDHVNQQFQVEIPRKPIIRRFDIHVGWCRRCGRRLQRRHPLQTSNATGAAASQLGGDLQALIALMKDKYGLSYGDIQGLLDEAFGISISRGGAAQVVLRVAERSEPVYDVIGQIVRCSRTVYPDETGWKIGGRLQWMWVFVTKNVVLYVIRASRGRDVPQEVLGADYDGRMIHDGWSPYNSFEQATHQQSGFGGPAATSRGVAGTSHAWGGSIPAKGQGIPDGRSGPSGPTGGRCDRSTRTGRGSRLAGKAAGPIAGMDSFA